MKLTSIRHQQGSFVMAGKNTSALGEATGKASESQIGQLLQHLQRQKGYSSSSVTSAYWARRAAFRSVSCFEASLGFTTICACFSIMLAIAWISSVEGSGAKQGWTEEKKFIKKDVSGAKTGPLPRRRGQDSLPARISKNKGLTSEQPEIY